MLNVATQIVADPSKHLANLKIDSLLRFARALEVTNGDAGRVTREEGGSVPLGGLRACGDGVTRCSGDGSNDGGHGL